ncbi:hypothetical protein DRE_01288 [Drechslerella stenobrocha 248]|uniref:AA9 family lytic polysaccharide monooxygenase n=1 Tax=Drechslerella stenobrocha 248 TaxID=1043628 RepID=W7HJ09_9PEZI|nr:hypothetical protein DRE_01288 [Drechslerella stenobrocha 248]
MKFVVVILFALMAALGTSAHQVITHFLVDDVRQSNVLRQPGTVSPITNPSSPDLTCGYPPQNGPGMSGNEKAIIHPGSKLTFEWHTNWSGDTPGPEGVTDVSHKGPCAIYMRQVSDAVSAAPQELRSPGWFKIWEDGVDSNGVFCTTRMRLNGGFFTGIVPKHLENGDYLIRAETITLNNAAEPHNEPQWYVSCAQVILKNSEAPFVKPFTITIPGGDYANLNMPGLRYNIWYPEREAFPDYGPVPGPAVYYDGGNKLDPPAGTTNGQRRPTNGGDGHPTLKPPTTATTSSRVAIPSFFTTIPWPGSSFSPMFPVTPSKKTTQASTRIATTSMEASRSASTTTMATRSSSTSDAAAPPKTVTVKYTRTVYVTHSHTSTHLYHHEPTIHRLSKTVTVTQVVTKTVRVDGETYETTTRATGTAALSATTPPLRPKRHADTWQYRRWHHGHAGMRRRF